MAMRKEILFGVALFAGVASAQCQGLILGGGSSTGGGTYYSSAVIPPACNKTETFPTNGPLNSCWTIPSGSGPIVQFNNQATNKTSQRSLAYYSGASFVSDQSIQATVTAAGIFSDNGPCIHVDTVGNAGVCYFPAKGYTVSVTSFTTLNISSFCTMAITNPDVYILSSVGTTFTVIDVTTGGNTLCTGTFTPISGAKPGVLLSGDTPGLQGVGNIVMN